MRQDGRRQGCVRVPMVGCNSRMAGMHCRLSRGLSPHHWQTYQDGYRQRTDGALCLRYGQQGDGIVPCCCGEPRGSGLYVSRQEWHGQEYTCPAVAEIYRRYGTGERRQSRGQHRQRRQGHRTWLALERQDILLPQCQLSVRRTGAAEPGPTQQDTPPERHRGLCGTGSEHQRQAVGRPHCRRSAPDGGRNGKPCTCMASGVSAR